MKKASGLTAREIAVDLIDEPKGVIRLEIDPSEVQDLAANIREVGLIQPLVVRRDGERYEIVAGHRRYLAVKGLGWREVSCIVREMGDLECAVTRASENLRRVDISPIEEAGVYADLHENHELSYDEIGKRMGKSAGVVKRRLDLLRMPPQLQKAIHAKQISYGVGEELWSIGDLGVIDYYLAFAIEHGVTVAVARGWAKDAKDAKRRRDVDVGEGGGAANPLEPRPTYLPCDICHGPEDVKRMQLIHTCESCGDRIRRALPNLSE